MHLQKSVGQWRVEFVPKKTKDKGLGLRDKLCCLQGSSLQCLGGKLTCQRSGSSDRTAASGSRASLEHSGGRTAAQQWFSATHTGYWQGVPLCTHRITFSLHDLQDISPLTFWGS